jgi:geranylgeranyl diphosphate synthase, type I
MADTPSYPSAYLEAIERELRSAVKSSPLPLTTPLGEEFTNIFQYHLGWTDPHGRPVAAGSGKRLRPLICLLSCEAAGDHPDKPLTHSWREAVPAAAAIELVHNFSLIHDDIEDRSAQRHGRATVWKVWGTAQGINAGDAVFVLARLALDRLFTLVPPATYADVHRIFDTATLALTRGQFLDLYFESLDDVTVDDYLEMVRGKTAALLAAAAQIGSRIATDDLRVVSAFARYGENLGIAFQIADDVLGIWGEPAITGKPAGEDIRAKKKSLPLLAAAQQDSGGEIAEFFRKDEIAAADVQRIAAILDRVNARESAEALAREHAERAHAALEKTGLSNPATEHLHGLVSIAVRREK